MNTTANPLPHPSDLQEGQALLCVETYFPNDDMFLVSMHDASPSEGYQFTIPALLLPMLVHEYGEPSEFIDRTFLIERGAKKADYKRLHDNLTVIVEETVIPGSRERRPVPHARIDSAASALNELPHPYQL